MIHCLESFGNGEEIFTANCCIKKPAEAEDIKKYVDQLKSRYASYIVSGGLIGELLPYPEIYAQWNKHRMAERKSMFAAIDILYVYVSEESGKIKADVLFNLRSRPMVPESKIQLRNLIKNGKIDICYRPNLMTFDLYYNDLGEDTLEMRDILTAANSWSELLNIFTSKRFLSTKK